MRLSGDGKNAVHSRIIYFPPGIIAEHDAEPGQLTALVTCAVDAYLRRGKGVRP